MAKRKRTQHRVNVFERVEPTPETKAKLVRDDWRLDLLNADQQWACQRILRGYELLSAGVGVKVADLLRTMGTPGPETPAEEIIERDYRAWWLNCSGKGLNLTAVHGVIVDPLSIAVTDPLTPHQKWIVREGGNRGVQFGYVEKALDEFVKMAGRAPVDSGSRVGV